MIAYNTRIVFMGTPEFAVGPLKSLHESGIEIAAIVTAPDKPAGRGKKIQMSAVKKYAEEHLDCPVFQPANLKDPDFEQQLKSIEAEIFIVVAFRMLPESIWTIPPKGTINLHASLLPHYRGAAPINWVLINGEKETGVTTFFINKQIDTGKILLQAEVNIDENDNAGTLHDKLMEAGAELLVKTITHLSTGNIEPINQKAFYLENNTLQTAPKIYKEDCHIDWSATCKSIRNRIRGFNPVPGAFTIIQSGNIRLQMKIFDATCSPEAHHLPVGSIKSDNKQFIKIACSDGFVEVLELQVEGKKRMSAEAFMRGFQDDLTNYSCN